MQCDECSERMERGLTIWGRAEREGHTGADGNLASRSLLSVRERE